MSNWNSVDAVAGRITLVEGYLLKIGDMETFQTILEQISLRAINDIPVDAPKVFLFKSLDTITVAGGGLEICDSNLMATPALSLLHLTHRTHVRFSYANPNLVVRPAINPFLSMMRNASASGTGTARASATAIAMTSNEGYVGEKSSGNVYDEGIHHSIQLLTKFKAPSPVSRKLAHKFTNDKVYHDLRMTKNSVIPHHYVKLDMAKKKCRRHCALCRGRQTQFGCSSCHVPLCNALDTKNTTCFAQWHVKHNLVEESNSRQELAPRRFKKGQAIAVLDDALSSDDHEVASEAPQEITNNASASKVVTRSAHALLEHEHMQRNCSSANLKNLLDTGD